MLIIFVSLLQDLKWVMNCVCMCVHPYMNGPFGSKIIKNLLLGTCKLMSSHPMSTIGTMYWLGHWQLN